ncbi:hypothetical protein Bbelb_287330 [Branchiostoma belcheri]|nr:hypothetical protein Bbelb_287330 [Branchiostoma belcheri]
MYEQAEAVRPSFSGPGSGHTSGPPQPRPVHQGGSRGHVRQGNGAPDKQPEDDDASSQTYEEAEAVRCRAAYTSAAKSPSPAYLNYHYGEVERQTPSFVAQHPL